MESDHTALIPEGTIPPADPDLICRRCKAPFASRKMLHQHLATCGKQEQHCRCAAVEQQLRSINASLEELLTSIQQQSKLGRPASLDLKPLKKSIILDGEDSVDYIRRLKSVFLDLPARLQHQQNTRWQLYENLRAFMPETYAKEREGLDKISMFKLFDLMEEAILDSRKEALLIRRPKTQSAPFPGAYGGCYRRGNGNSSGNYGAY